MKLFDLIGRRVATLRDARGWSQEELAERAGLSAGYVAHVEGGSRRPTVMALDALARALDVPLWRLFASTRLSAAERTADAQFARLLRAAEKLDEKDRARLVELADRLGRG